MSIEKTYELIKKEVHPSMLMDSLDVVKQVEKCRQFWKPAKTNVVLLAESHVYTNEKDFETECKRNLMEILLPNYPSRYVRFVYCLGYGENELLSRRLEDNPGTPQYWKIFSSCVADSLNNLSFRKVTKKETPSLLQRLRNKVCVLQEMKRRGLWLLDASIVGIYRAIDDSETKEKIIRICWDEHVKDVILESRPKHILVIGKGVEAVLGCRLNKADISCTVLPQPQGVRGSSEVLSNYYSEYQRICSEFS
jgi:hypothetical protein